MFVVIDSNDSMRTKRSKISYRWCFTSRCRPFNKYSVWCTRNSWSICL